MDEIFTGKLTVKDEKKGRRWFLVYTSKKSAAMNEPISPDKFSKPLRDSQESEIEVAFELDHSGRPYRIRPVGVDWQDTTLIAQAAPTGNAPRHAPRNQRDNLRRDDHQFNNKMRQGMTNANQDLAREFHNPYNFVPAIPRQHINGNKNELGDREPSGHDRYIADKYSGKLRVRMRVETPLPLIDTARMHYNNEHKSYPVRVDVDGKPFINPTAIKGMLRSAYEAVTNSRLSVFGGHDERLAFRMDAGDALKLVPARIENEKVFLYVGNTQMENNGLPIVTRTINKPNQRHIEIREMYAAWLGQYKEHGQSYKNLDKHGKEVWAFITKWEHQKFDFWNVVEIRDGNLTEPMDAPNDTTRQTANWHKAKKINPSQGRWVKGYVCKTNRNIERKHDERVFFMPKGQNPIEAKVIDFDNLKKDWKRLIENYSQIHEGEEPPKDDRNRSRFEWSTFIKDSKNHKELKNGTLCYAKVKKIGNDWHVLELLPVMISRRLHTKSPLETLPDELNLKPGKILNELSPADRVFGWVGHGVKKNGAYRGQLRIGVVNCNTEDAIEYFDKDNPCNWLPLQVLGQPKPQQGRFYVAQNQNGDAQPDGLNNEDSGYMEKTNYRQRMELGDETKKGLRGHKVYPHHNSLPDDYWKDPTNPNLETSKKGQGFYKEYRRRRDKDRKEQRDSQNRSIQGWVKKDVMFEFDVHFINLSEIELGALVWLLSLDANQFHRLGGGKPLGFGSVHLNLEDNNVRSGEHWNEFYKLLEDDGKGKLDKSAIEKFATDFKTLVDSVYPTILQSFIRACEGFTDNLPTHYPRARHYQGHYPQQTQNSLPPHEEGLAYEWFVENNKKTSNNNPNVETQLVLPNITEDKGMPIFWHKE